MLTKNHLKITAEYLCEQLDSSSWYDLTTGPKAQLADPLQLDDGIDELNAPIPLSGNDLLDWVEGHLSGRLHGKDGRLHFKVAEPMGRIISAGCFVEALLGAANRVDDALRGLTKIVAGTVWTLRAMRNELTHNMTSGHIQPSCFVGRGTKLVAASQSATCRRLLQTSIATASR